MTLSNSHVDNTALLKKLLELDIGKAIHIQYTMVVNRPGRSIDEITERNFETQERKHFNKAACLILVNNNK